MSQHQQLIQCPRAEHACTVIGRCQLLDRKCRVLEGVQLLSDGLSEVSDNLKLTVQFLSDDFAAVSEVERTQRKKMSADF